MKQGKEKRGEKGGENGGEQQKEKHAQNSMTHQFMETETESRKIITTDN